ncbi:MAG: hypothetical protein JXB88_24290 [Spirochaetales bacterium]|nr:hypothetical protein [Spirochaetales bacterium]
MKNEKEICTQCILHSRVPEVTIGEDGLCVYCRISNHLTEDMIKQNSLLLETKMERILKKAGQLNRPFDVLVYFSGGKDSTYILNVMKNKYKMRVLAYSMIQPFVTDVAQENMEKIVKALGVEAVKFFIKEEIFKKMIGFGIIHGHKYGLTEWVGCEICGFLTKWVGIKIAMSFGIPLVVDGMDYAQSGGGGITEGEKTLIKMKNGKKPFGRIHDLCNDALGAEYKTSIYGYNEEELLQGRYPTQLSPLCFLDYDPVYSFEKLESMGLSYKQFKSLNTNCELLYLFDYISMKRYDCDSYIKLYASGLRQNYDTIEQLELDRKEHKKRLSREEMITLLDEYKNVLFYVIDNNIDENTTGEKEKNNLLDLIKFSRQLFGEDTIDKLLDRVLKMHRQADYLNIDLQNLDIRTT